MTPGITERIDFDGIFEELKRRNALRVGLQLPDGLKFRAKEIADIFESRGYEVIISGSHSFGACDLDLSLLDEVDVLVHFAHTPIYELDMVIYAPYYYEYDFDRIYDILKETGEKKIVLAGTAQYAWKFEELKRFLEERGFEVSINPAKRVKFRGQVLGCSYGALRAEGAIVYIGDGLFHAFGAGVYTGRRVYAINPLSGELRVIGEREINDFLKARYLAISKAMERIDEGVGIIVTSKIGQKRIALARKLKKMADNANVASKILFFDDISPEKLANFNFGVYVNTACPRISYDDIRRYDRPIITPQEFEIVLGLRKWEDYEMDEM
ncbi:diphthamide biosynthesis enzyme Dph2 [Archaeoglobus sulfaticallidus PM70-1]|uniref:2-(3-amino-3-carboxypropyl)histidine synthase n=1 Tax=Archaeoglobus sulfaticallidus PM70-1 TaxID=387631 RepID=N0BJB2_9EURY|nr:diphthamide biosynthesis enzyme Dph2 [Archaeoglobus sulfaticallidus]AGK60541.1 diphthamide biosynthesis enzyme Dph2 [Archaeoglobus sulfaticallidus PM70-1]